MKSVRKPLLLSILLLVCVLALAACSQKQDVNAAEEESTDAETETVQEAASSDAEETDAEEETITMKMRINDTDVNVSWENNASVKALSDLAEQGDVTISMSPYGGFEQVGPIGTTLPSNDTSIKTHAGDIMLYTSDQMVIFYGSNSWS